MQPSSTRAERGLARRARPRLGARAVLCLLAVLVATIGCQRSERGAAGSIEVADRTPIVLISIDTLRSDRLPIYGYDHVSAPAIEALRDDSILFERAYSHIGLTLPSHSSILSGLLPLEHGVRDNVGYRFPDDTPTLAVRLKSEGYATGGFVSSFVLRATTGISRGFDVYDDDIAFETGKQLGTLQRPGGETLERAISWLERTHREPFFLFFHIYEPHAPYEPPPRFATRYADPYDGEVAAADAIVGDLIAALRRLDVYDDALIVLLSDHGEGLMDHGERDHLVFVYREVLQVPLLIKLPQARLAGTSVTTPAQLTDVVPTVLSLLGLESDPRWAGVPLLPLAQGPAEERPILSESVYPRIHFGWSDLASIVSGDFHYIDGPDPELYDLEQDPRETNNIVRSERAATRRLRAELDKYDRTLEAPEEVDATTREQLSALGYISGGAVAEEGDLADPKSKIHILDALGRASALAREGDNEKAAELYRTVLAEEPGMALAWQQLGSVLMSLEDRPGALEALKRALELSHGSGEIAVSVADLYFEMGDLEAARAHAELALPSDGSAHNILAKIALQEGDLEAAERHLEPALENRGRRIEALIVKAAVLNRRGQNQEALEVCQQAEAEFGDRGDRQVLHGLYFQRGNALGSLGRFEEAIESHRQAIELAPHHIQAYAALVFLYALAGDSAGSGGALEEMLTANPNPRAYMEAVKTLRAMSDEASANAVLALAIQRWPDNEDLRSF